jgi:hypothetical protein
MAILVQLQIPWFYSIMQATIAGGNTISTQSIPIYMEAFGTKSFGDGDVLYDDKQTYLRGILRVMDAMRF